MATFAQYGRGLVAGVATLAAVAVTNIADAQQTPADAAQINHSGVRGNNVCGPDTDKLCLKGDPRGIHLVHKFRNGADTVVGVCSIKTQRDASGEIVCGGEYRTDAASIAAALRGQNVFGAPRQ